MATCLIKDTLTIPADGQLIMKNVTNITTKEKKNFRVAANVYTEEFNSTQHYKAKTTLSLVITIPKNCS